jgi:hypothetical protein
MSAAAGHKLVCLGAPLARGVRKERPWSCSCGGWSTTDYDAGAKRSHRAHRDAQS